MNTFVKTIQTDRLSKEFLRSLNGLMSLTDRELELFSVLLDIQLENSKTKNKKQSIDTAENRKRVMTTAKVTKDNLSRYMKLYRDKGIIVKENNSYVINKALIPIVINNKTVQITMILKLKENEI